MSSSAVYIILLLSSPSAQVQVDSVLHSAAL